MLDMILRNLATAPRAAVMERTKALGIGAQAIHAAGFVLGLGAAAAVATGHGAIGAAFLLLGRIVILTATGESTIDIALEYVVFACLSFGFALADPSRSLAALFVMTGLMAAGMTQVVPHKSLLARALGGSEIAIAFLVAALLPAWFSLMAYILGVLCFVSAGARVADAVATAGQP